MNCSSHAKVLLAFEEAFIEAGERAAHLAAEKASELGLAVTYSDGTDLLEVLPDGSIRTMKRLDTVRIGNESVDGDELLLTPAFDPRKFED